MRTQVTLSGDWEKARFIFGRLAYKLKRATARGHKAEAEAAVRRIKNNIFTGNYARAGWPELSPVTVEKKAAEGKDPRTLIEDGEYVRAIRAIHLGGGVWGVGIGRDDPENARKGHTHEYGGKFGKATVPARPHYRVELERIRSGKLPTIRQSLRHVLEGRKGDFVR